MAEIYVLSDGTGETADKLVQAALVQFPDHDPLVSRFKTLKSELQIESIIQDAKAQNAVIVYTVARHDLRTHVEKISRELNVVAVDLLGPLLDKLSIAFDAKPELRSGRLHEVNEEYFKRIEAIEFTVKHDDGSNPDNLVAADIILVGVSRTSKTPLSIFLSHKGWKVANVPLVKGIDPPQTLFEVDQEKIIALIIDPETLAKIRKERLARMGRDPTGSYASLQHIRDEIEWVRHIYARNRRWPVYDVTNKALEETAAEIERTITARRRQKDSSS